ncbi:hypothetical protein [Thiothrix lacustris]|jgi:hypothetical protein|uniref:Uncharacterized protein n=1 Tax=Thiothrix lacustris TaxID=525917 RepID=A0ABY9MQL9_9GAMM|nr:hypothetical protein [Thiothrix lacustris]WML90955.1 hypothetical protein RCF98_01060 [Thiothrix lacustris]WMP17351.1 hypothetical protein RCS87_18485 [Thiothrix lacustris]
MLRQTQKAGLLLIILSLMATPVNAQWKHQPTAYAGSSFKGQSDIQNLEKGLPAPYAQIQYLLGHRLYGYLLKNDEFIVLQDLVITHLEKHYPVYSTK